MPSNADRRLRSEVLTWMMAAAAFNYFGRVIMSIAGPEVMKQYGLSETQLGAVFSAFGGAYLLAMIPAGWATDWFGARRTLSISGVISGFTTAATGLCLLGSEGWTIWILLIFARGLFGVASSPIFPACGRLTGAWFQPDRYGLVQGCITGASAVGASAAPVVFAWAISRIGGVWSFCYTGAFLVLFFSVFAKRVRDQPSKPLIVPTEAAAGAHGIGFAAVARSPAILLLALAYSTLGYVYGTFDYWIYYYLRDVRHMDQSSSAVFSGVAQATQLLTIPLGGWLSDTLYARSKSGRVWLAVILSGCSAGLFIVAPRITDVAGTIALLCAAFGLASAVDATYFATAIDVATNESGTACGIVNAGGSVGSFLSPMLLPIIAARFGWSTAIGSAGAVIAAAVLIWLFLDRALKGPQLSRS